MAEITIFSAFSGLFCLFYLLLTGFFFGKRFFTDFVEPFRTIMGSAVTLALLSVFGSVLYYVTDVTTLGLALISAVVGGISLYAYVKRKKVEATKEKRAFVNATEIGYLIASLAGLGAFLSAVLTHTVTGAVRSPFDALPPLALGALMIAFFAAAFLVKKAETVVGQKGGLILLMGTLFMGTALPALLYPLGYGFDPFLHRATVSHILEFGTITPKPLYYIGEYALLLFGAKIGQLPLFTLDVFLLPTLFALFVPAAVSREKHATLFFALLPFAGFISTTPQALSFLFTFLTILVTAPKLLRGEKIDVMLGGIFAVAAAFAHPLSGSIAVLYVLMLAFKDNRILRGILTAFVAIDLPVAFLLQAYKAHADLHLAFPSFADVKAIPLTLFLGTGYSAPGDIAYLIINNLFIGILIASIVVLVVHRKNAGTFFIPALVAGGGFASFFILSLFFHFDYLISYERLDFTLRILTIVTLFLLPYLAHASADYFDKRATLPVLLLSTLFIANVYGAYPRDDAYTRSAAFNVTNADMNAVRMIDAYANGKPYVVLANQATSSAAITEFGFKKYYPGDIFFYPIPTGGPLYTEYLSMTENPSEDVIERVRALTGAELVFFVVDDYWWDSARVTEQTKTLTPTVWDFGDGAVTVAVFE